MKPSASFIFDAKIIKKQYRQFHKVFTWNCGTIKNKNKDGFCWNLIFSIKQGNKSRLHTVISFATLTTIPQYFRSAHWNHKGIWLRKNKLLHKRYYNGSTHNQKSKYLFAVRTSKKHSTVTFIPNTTRTLMILRLAKQGGGV